MIETVFIKVQISTFLYHLWLLRCYNSFGNERAGLAGLRVGYGAFPLVLIEYLWRAKQPYNVSVAAEVAACAALTNPTYLEVRKPLKVQSSSEKNLDVI